MWFRGGSTDFGYRTPRLNPDQRHFFSPDFFTPERGIKLGRVQGGACVPPRTWRNASPPPNPPQGGGAPNKSQPLPYKVQPQKTNLLLMDIKLGKSARGACVPPSSWRNASPPPQPPQGGGATNKSQPLPYKVCLSRTKSNLKKQVCY